MAEVSTSVNAGVKPIRGKPKSGRVWKDERKPVHTLIKKTRTKNAIWKKRMQDKVDALTTKVGHICATLCFAVAHFHEFCFAGAHF